MMCRAQFQINDTQNGSYKKNKNKRYIENVGKSKTLYFRAIDSTTYYFIYHVSLILIKKHIVKYTKILSNCLNPIFFSCI